MTTIDEPTATDPNSTVDDPTPIIDDVPTRAQVEEFLYLEAEMLDEWRLEQWLTLFEDDATYQVPATDLPHGRPETSLFLIADDRARLEARVTRLLSRNAHAENPRSRTRHQVTNVLIGPGSAPETIDVRAVFTIWRIRRGKHDMYVGSYRHEWAYGTGRLRYRSRKAILDLDTLRPAGKVSIIL